MSHSLCVIDETRFLRSSGDPQAVEFARESVRQCSPKFSLNASADHSFFDRVERAERVEALGEEKRKEFSKGLK